MHMHHPDAPASHPASAHPANAGAATAGAAHPPSCLGLLLGDAVRKMGAGGCSPATLAGLLEFVVKLALLDTQQLVEQLAAMQVAQPGAARRHACLHAC